MATCQRTMQGLALFLDTLYHSKPGSNNMTWEPIRNAESQVPARPTELESAF